MIVPTSEAVSEFAVTVGLPMASKVPVPHSWPQAFPPRLSALACDTQN